MRRRRRLHVNMTATHTGWAKTIGHYLHLYNDLTDLRIIFGTIEHDKPKTRYARFRLDWPALCAGPARAYHRPALRAGQARAARGPITQLSANRPSDFYNIDTCIF